MRNVNYHFHFTMRYIGNISIFNCAKCKFKKNQKLVRNGDHVHSSLRRLVQPTNNYFFLIRHLSTDLLFVLFYFSSKICSIQIFNEKRINVLEVFSIHEINIVFRFLFNSSEFGIYP